MTKKLCLVIPTMQVGGMERVASQLADYFCLIKYFKVHMILYGKKPEIFYNLPEGLIIHKPTTVFNNKFRFIFSIGRLIFVRNTVKNINPCSILSFGELWNSFTLLALLGLQYPVYISDRSSPGKKFNLLHSVLRKWLYPKAKGIIAQTKIARDIYYHQFRHENIKVIGNPIKQIKSSQVKKENIVLSVGRLITSKHHDELIRMFNNINENDWKLVIVGDDALKQHNRSKLNSLIKDLKCEQKVELTGRRSDVMNYYLRSKIFAFTSSSEGFPNVIGEAMAAGLPVVAWDCVAGPSELIKDGENGFLVPLFERKLFETRLKELMNNEKLIIQMGEKAKKKAEEYNLEYIGDQFKQFILGI